MPLQYGIARGVRETAAPCIPLAKAWGAAYSGDAPLLDLSQGVPGDAPHQSVLDALARVSATPEAAKYGPILGEPALRAALADELAHLYGSGADIASDDIAITAGCNMAFLALLVAICTPFRSSVLIPLPSYFNHTMSLSLLNIAPEYVPCDPGTFTPSIESVREILAGRGKQVSTEGSDPGPSAILLTSPNNPTGAVYPTEELEAWLALAKEHNIPLILDETYRDFAPPHRLFNNPQWRETLISVGSFSKQYRIPGHRLGSITASPELLAHVATVLDCMQICAPRPPQLALAPLLPSLRSDLARSSAALRARLAAFTEAVAAVPGWRVVSSGGFYAYVEFPEAYASRGDRLGVETVGSADVGKALATQCGVLTLPGSFFMPDLSVPVPWSNLEGDAIHADRWIRFAIANVSDEVVQSLAPRLRALNDIMGV